MVDKLGIPQNKWSELLSNFRLDPASREQVYAALYRIIHEIQNKNTVIKELIEPILDPRYPSQLLAALTEGLFSFLVLFFLARKSRKPGFVAASFAIVYAASRIFNEYFREPDIQIGFQLWGLTRGQWLSIGLFFIEIGRAHV